jgi:hypothetical protein
MPDDQAQQILTPVAVDKSIKANAWEAYNSAQNEDELGVRLQGINLPREVKAQLWEAKKSGIGPEQRQISQLPNPALQSKQQLLARAPGLTRDTGRYPQSMNAPADQDAAQMRSIMSGVTGTPDVSNVTPTQAAGGMATGLLAGSAFAAPVATAMGVAGSTAGEYGLEKTAKEFGASPEKAKMWGTTGGIIGGLFGGEAGGRVNTAIREQAASLFKASPERIARLQAALPKEQAIAQSIANAEPASRAAFHSAADAMGIDAAPSNIASMRNLANNAISVAQKYGYKGPSAVRSISNAYEPTVEDLGKQLPEVMQSDNPNVILQQLKDVDTMPFREVQRRVADIEQWISRNHPQAELYDSLKAVSNSGKAALEKTASDNGQAAQYKVFKKMFADHVDDFWDKNAPLRPWAGNNPRIEPDMTGKTVNEFLSNAKMGRVLEALKRRGVDTAPIKDFIAQEARKPGSVAEDMRDAGFLDAVGRQPLDLRAADARKVSMLKAGAGLTGVGAGLYELRHLLSKAK